MADLSIWTEAQTGTASYTTGGFTITTSLSSVVSAHVEIQTPGANLGQSLCDVTVSGATFIVKVFRQNFDELTTIGSVIGLPTGVTAETTSGQTYDTVSHLHTLTHDHAVTPASGGPIGIGSNTLAAVAQPAVTTHTHTVDLPSHSGNMVAETAHTHTWDNIYQHAHSITNTQTDLTATELTNGTDLSGTTFVFRAVGT